MHRRLTLVALTGVARDLACCVTSSLGFSCLASAGDAAACFATFFVHCFAASAFMVTSSLGFAGFLSRNDSGTGNLPNLLC